MKISFKFFIAIVAILLQTSCQKQNKEFDISVSCGETFTIELQSSPSTGMGWKWTNKDEVSCIDTIGVEIIPTIENHRGVPEIEKWIFKGLKKGECSLLFDYVDYTDNKSVVDTKEFKILVKNK